MEEGYNTGKKIKKKKQRARQKRYGPIHVHVGNTDKFEDKCSKAYCIHGEIWILQMGTLVQLEKAYA
jgi:hypothetical protein